MPTHFGMVFSPFALSVALLVVVSLVVPLVVAGTFVHRRLERALRDVETLQGLLPMCAWCKRVADTDGTWLDLEAYVRKHSGSSLTHGICPTCSRQFDVGNSPPPT